MIALIVGVVLVALAVLACVPVGLDWWQDVLAVLRGALPLLAALVGLIAVFIGIADIKDRMEAKREEAEEEKEAKEKAASEKKD